MFSDIGQIDRIGLNFFGHFKKILVYDRKMTEKNKPSLKLQINFQIKITFAWRHTWLGMGLLLKIRFIFMHRLQCRIGRN